MSRAERIRRALAAGETAGTVAGWYCCSGMPGRRWIVWGSAVGAHEYGTSLPAMTAERAYRTVQCEAMLSSAGLLA